MIHQLLLIVIGIGWLVFWLYWLVSAVGAKKNLRQDWGYSTWFRIALLAVALIVVRFSSVRGIASSYSMLAVHSAALEVVGAALFVAGLAFAVWARLHLGKNWGMPMAQKDTPELITSGPYRYVRHPIYTGVLAAIAGTALTVSLYWLFILVAAGLYFIVSATREEKYMVQQFPQDYPGYKKRSRMLIPFIL